MKRNRIPRILAALLALVMLGTTGLAETAITGDEAVQNALELSVVDGDLELAGDFVDVDLAGELDGLSTDLAIDGLSPEVLSDSVETQQQSNSIQFLLDAQLIELGVKEKYALDAKAIGQGKTVTFKSSNKKVATVSSKGVIKAVKKGSATITCKVKGKKKATYKVKVVAAPGSVKLDEANVILGVKEYITLTPTIPDGTHASFTWSTKNKSVATVSKEGKITGKKAGTTTVTVKTQNGKKAKVNVKVMKAPSQLELNKSAATLKPKGTLQLKAMLPNNTYSSIIWSSSDSKIAEVSDGGKVTALAVGTATITAATYNGYSASCEVTVKASDAKYRALLIGQEHFGSGYSGEVCTRNRGDVLNMSRMLESVTGLYGGKFSITPKYDLTAKEVLGAIRTTFADADDDDVSLFFIATHGDVNDSGEFAGALSMCPSGELMLKDLADALQAVPGKVVVMLESCGSGAAVYASNSAGSDSASVNKARYEEVKKRIAAFDAAVIQAFSNADTGIRVALQANDVDSNGLRVNTGEFRVENKFYVLTASDYQELSWGWESSNEETSYNYFTLWLTQGVGTYGSMPADVDNNGRTTLNELYQYISDVGDNYPFGNGVYQHVQVYPAKSKYVLFCR